MRDHTNKVRYYFRWFSDVFCFFFFSMSMIFAESGRVTDPCLTIALFFRSYVNMGDYWEEIKFNPTYKPS